MLKENIKKKKMSLKRDNFSREIVSKDKNKL